MSKKFTHRVSAPFVTVPTRYATCQHWSYANRKLSQCGAETEDGKPTCKSCKALESAGPRQARKDLITTYV